LQPKFDLGSTTELVDRLRDWMLQENPEASFYSQLRGMREVTAPAAERILGDAVSLCKRARSGMDVGTIKLFQMGISIVAMRLRAGDYANPNSDRLQAFLPYNENSYAEGKLDFGIKDRPVISQSESERLYVIQLRESLTTHYGLRQAGLEEAEIESIFEDRKNAATLVSNNVAVAPDGPPNDEPEVEEEETDDE
jgi:hypothetical protein